MAKRKKKVALGRPLPPAPDSEFEAETMRQWAYNQAAVHAQKFGSDEFNAMLGAEEDDSELIPNA
jgi:hypothetical protein